MVNCRQWWVNIPLSHFFISCLSTLYCLTKNIYKRSTKLSTNGFLWFTTSHWIQANACHHTQTKQTQVLLLKSCWPFSMTKKAKKSDPPKKPELQGMFELHNAIEKDLTTWHNKYTQTPCCEVQACFPADKSLLPCLLTARTQALRLWPCLDVVILRLHCEFGRPEGGPCQWSRLRPALFALCAINT